MNIFWIHNLETAPHSISNEFKFCFVVKSMFYTNKTKYEDCVKVNCNINDLEKW